MADLFEFQQLFSDVAPSAEVIDGRLFLDRSHVGVAALRLKAAEYPTLREAQLWMNLVPIDDLIDCAVEDWSIDDPLIERIAETFRRAWLALCAHRVAVSEGLSVELLKDPEGGDVMLRLTQV